MTDNQNLSLERFIAKTEADIHIVNSRMEGLEAQINLTNLTIEKMKQEIDSLKLSMDKVEGKVSSLNKNFDTLSGTVGKLDDSITSVNHKVDRLSRNSLLEFTNDFDLKKLILLVTLITTVISSPTILTTWLDNTQKSPQIERIDRLIELLENSP